MIHDLDRTLEQLLRDRVPLRDGVISFDVPDDGFRQRLASGLTTNLYLYEIKENHELRSPEWPLERKLDGRVVKHRPKVRIDLFYLVTAWSPSAAAANSQPDVLAEHSLLSRILRTLLRYPLLPAELLQGTLIGQEPSLPIMVAQPNGMGSPGEFWSALHQAPRPAIHLMVTLTVDPSGLTDSESLIPVVSRALGFGQTGGRLVRLTVRPSLSQSYPLGARLRRMTVGAAPVAYLKTDVFASTNLIRVTAADALVSHEWVRIGGDPNMNFVKLGEVPGPGVQNIAVSPPLRSQVPPLATDPVFRVTAPDQDLIVTTLETQINKTTLQIADRSKVSANDVLLISDEERTEVVQVSPLPVNLGTGRGNITVSASLRFSHPNNRNIYKRTLNKPFATTLAQDAAQSGSSIVLFNTAVAANAQLAPADTALMVGTGPNVEFCRTSGSATNGNAVAVTPSLRNNHPVGTSVRVLAEAEIVGQLEVAASADSTEVMMIGDPTAVEQARRQGRPLVSAGDVLLLGETATGIAFQVADVQERPAALQSAPEQLYSIGGWVTDSATPPNPILGAKVALSDERVVSPGGQVTWRALGLTATTDAEGRFTFVNLTGNQYHLQVTATGYRDLNPEKLVNVPAQSVNEYRVTLPT